MPLVDIQMHVRNDTSKYGHEELLANSDLLISGLQNEGQGLTILLNITRTHFCCQSAIILPTRKTGKKNASVTIYLFPVHFGAGRMY